MVISFFRSPVRFFLFETAIWWPSQAFFSEKEVVAISFVASLGWRGDLGVGSIDKRRPWDPEKWAAEWVELGNYLE